MKERLDALPAAHRIAADYQRYLRSLMPIADDEIRAALHHELSSDALLRGPYLEATPAYRRGASPRDLIAEGVLPAAFAEFDSEHLPLNRRLFVHQEEALRKIRAGRNAVVATGTGSGKTESFLLPILAALAEEHEKGALDAGVRALLMYPMNALANDQMKRLRGVLGHVPWVTFGRYIGETKTDLKAARDAHRARFGEPPLANELVSREQMRQGPPHLLLTNYAMLEYLLLRPEDLALFDAEAQTWRFMVVDEAHVYDGATGAEVAMLLRRLRDRVRASRIQGIATSATVGSESTLPNVARFAANLFDLPFEWEPDDPARQDVVRASRVAPPTATWVLPADRFQELSRAPREERPASGTAPDSAQPFTGASAPDTSDDPWLTDLDEESDAASSAGSDAGQTVEQLMLAAAGVAAEPTAAETLARESHLERIRSALLSGPRLATELALEVFGEDPDALDSLAGLVHLAAGLRDREDNPVLSARYHLWVASVDRGYVCLYPGDHHGYLKDRQACERCREQGRSGVPVWQFAACQRCSTGYVYGRRVDGGSRSWYALTPESGTADDDEIETPGNAPAGLATVWLCPGCGRDFATAGECGRCGLGLLAVVPVDEPGSEDRPSFDPPSRCVHCGGARSGLIRGLNSGLHASTAVLTTSTYQELPSQSAALPGHGRKLLVFSDSRQQAAYFAPYLEGSYQEILWRSLIHRAVVSTEQAAHGPATFTNVLDRLQRIADDRAVRPTDGGHDRLNAATHAAGWLLAEVSTGSTPSSLSGRGMLHVSSTPPPRMPAPLLALGLTPVEAWDLVENLLGTAREAGCITEPDDLAIPHLHPAFRFRFPDHGMRVEGPEPKRRIQSWLPGKGSNKRLDYVQRVLDAKGSGVSAAEVLGGIWQWARHEKIGLLEASQNARGVVYRVALGRLRLSSTGTRYRCDTCGTWQWRSVAGVCITKSCTGRLTATELPPVQDDDDHYRTLYRSIEPSPLLAMEHTAQWTAEEAAKIQEAFIRGHLNVLSCSTTFELGVDVGDLQSVLLRNVPPTTANYVQRAGRAGRRGSAAALVVTFARSTPHDVTMFEDPRAMIAGTMRAPYLPVDNDRIARRHVHSIVMSDFFRTQSLQGRTWSTMQSFFSPETPTDGTSLLREHLAEIPDRVRESALAVVPTALHEVLKLNGRDWADELVGHVADLRDEYVQEHAQLQAALEEAVADRRPGDRFLKAQKTVERRRLLDRLAVKNVLPKYGFPVDVVELATYHLGPFGEKLDLSRDLAQAITEYAPGSRIVAGSRVLMSAGLAIRAGRGLPEYQYGTCSGQKVKHFVLRAEGMPFPEQCPDCGAALSMRRATRPEFGFVCASEQERIGHRPPRLLYPGDAQVVRFSDSPQHRRIVTPVGPVELSWGKRAELALIGEGEGTRGWWICMGCGRGIPASNSKQAPSAHKTPMTGRDCAGRMARRRLIHTFETDVVAITLPGDALAPLDSALAAIVAGASDALEIPIEDIGGTTRMSGDRRQVVLYDTVPGGAGNAMRVAEQFEVVVAHAIRRVRLCTCGMDASCYACLKNHQNQRSHEDLTRQAALARLEPLNVDGEEDRTDSPPPVGRPSGDSPANLPDGWPAVMSQADPDLHALVRALATDGVPLPEVGLEVDHGRLVVELAWAERRVAVVRPGEEDLAADLSQLGWRVFLPSGDVKALVDDLQEAADPQVSPR